MWCSLWLLLPKIEEMYQVAGYLLWGRERERMSGEMRQMSIWWWSSMFDLSVWEKKRIKRNIRKRIMMMILLLMWKADAVMWCCWCQTHAPLTLMTKTFLCDMKRWGDVTWRKHGSPHFEIFILFGWCADYTRWLPAPLFLSLSFPLSLPPAIRSLRWQGWSDLIYQIMPEWLLITDLHPVNQMNTGVLLSFSLLVFSCFCPSTWLNWHEMMISNGCHQYWHHVDNLSFSRLKQKD